MKRSTIKGGTIKIDADDFLELIDQLSDIESRLRVLGSKGFKLSTQRESTRDKDKSTPIQLDIDISDIEWTLPKSQGGGSAGPNAKWCWSFGYNQNGGIRKEAMELVQALIQYGSVQVGSYVLELGGRDRRLLNRRKVS